MKCETPARPSGLVPRAGADPVPDRDRADVVDLLRDHPLAGVELGQDPVLHAQEYRTHTVSAGRVAIAPCVEIAPAGV